MSLPRTISGSVRLDAALAESGGTLFVRVEDVTRADAAAIVVAQAAVPVAGPLEAGASVPFSLVLPAVDEKAHYAVRVHLDTTGSRSVTPGDLISTAAYPVATFGHPDAASLVAMKV